MILRNIQLNNEMKSKINLFLLTDVNNELIVLLKEINIGINLYYFEEIDWESDFSIWPYKNFKGNGDNTIKIINDLNIKDLYLCGYSLGGLLALYSIDKVNNLKGIGSVSGSLWYPDFEEYLLSKNINKQNIYLSLGNKEANCKNQLMKTVLDKTNNIYDYLRKNNTVLFEMNEGNHFYLSNQRICKCIKYFASEM